MLARALALVLVLGLVLGPGSALVLGLVLVLGLGLGLGCWGPRWCWRSRFVLRLGSRWGSGRECGAFEAGLPWLDARSAL